MKDLYLLLLSLCMSVSLPILANDGGSLWLPEFKSAPIRTTQDVVDAELSNYENVVAGTAQNREVRKHIQHAELKELGSEDFIIRRSKDKIIIAGGSQAGLLYGVYHLQRLVNCDGLPPELNIKQSPRYALRLLNHWDNLDGTVERGYAGRSIWWQDEMLPEVIPVERYTQYARANASVGINGTVINNVNASPKILSTLYLQKVKAIADVLRPYKIKVYLSVNFSSPAVLGGLATSDPLNEEVKRWWKEKASEIYRLIPDFGGFLVKANSEGQPGPQDYGRSHAEGANMLAAALKPYSGVVMWRAFVYSPSTEDRAKQAYNEFMPLDGLFADNVIIQVKNGPVDFQPREPVNPLLGGMRHTAVMPEFQITQEYLGFSNHLVYLSPLFKECLESDTFADGKGSTVARMTDGSVSHNRLSAIAGVSNIGLDKNWCGHHFAQANWYAFGRLGWDHSLTSEQIAQEWIKQTFSKNEEFIATVRGIMMNSREAAVNYMMPLGLHHIFAWDHHYGPQPWGEFETARADWLPKYYHQADSFGLGFDRTQTGSNAVSQYHSPLNSIYNDPTLCPDELLLWFHHLPWDFKMKNGRTMWDELCRKYDLGVMQSRDFQREWDKMEQYIDHERFTAIQSKLRIQASDAVWWRDACLLYFQTFSKRAIPYDLERPVHELDDLKRIELDMKHHN